MSEAAMEFVNTPVRPTKITKHVATRLTKKLALEAVEPLGSSTLLWFLVRRHRVGLLMCIVLFENAALVVHYFQLFN